MNEAPLKTAVKAAVLSEVIAFTAPVAARFGFSGDEDGHWSTREHGSVGDEEPGEIDIANARFIGREVRRQFSNAHVTIETVDEWTELHVEIV